ncbi:MAG: M56 family metallopeptidase [Oscillibacter sp.]|nr:M56 family metallopeptidase [Oscillibacter sp.]
MSLLQMSFSGGVLILAVVVLRALTLNRLPKGTFLALWAVAVLRLLVPFSIPSPASVYTLAERIPVQESAETVTQTANPANTLIPTTAVEPAAPTVAPSAAVPSPAPAAPDVDLRPLVWTAGALVCAGVFLLSYLRSRRTFRSALPVEAGWVPVWLARHRLRRPIALRQSGETNLPLTYGVLRPVILLPEEQQEDTRLEWVLEHEFTHIQRFDSVCKLILAAAACVHWFNPLVWVMLALANRDMELRCDEAVVRRLGLERRGDYARALISMEEQKSGLGPFASAFNKSAIEERIIAIMKTKKRSLAAILAAVVLVCCVGAAFATSAMAENKTPYPKAPDGTFTEAELDRLAGLWFEGYKNMTVAAYQQKMWTERDTPEDIALIDRYGQSSAVDAIWNEPETVTPSMAFHDYFNNVYRHLTAEGWQSRVFPGREATRLEDGRDVFLEYTYTLRILDPEKLTVGEYEQVQKDIKAGVKALLEPYDTTDADFTALSQRLSTDCLSVTVEAGLPTRSGSTDDGRVARVETADGYVYVPFKDLESMQWRETANGYGYVDPDAALHAQFSSESAAEWDRLLTPYAPFGLTYQFYDPDLDGNGLTMWFNGKEVRGIYDEREHTWLTEHAGPGFSDGAVELYAVYTNGVLSGLREADPDEQEGFDEIRQGNAIYAASFQDNAETREFPQATEEDYASLLNLRTDQTYRTSLENFNQRVLNWANANSDAWDRINCDVIWNDYGVHLSEEERTFISLTCFYSGMENGQMVRALHTGGPEEDPGFSSSMHGRTVEGNGIVIAWCDLYYDISYHITDKSKVTVAERDALVGGMINAINTFWQDTDLEALLQMTEEDVVSQFNLWGAEYSTENITFNPITADNIHFEACDERGIN